MVNVLKKSFMCEICESHFKQRSNLNRHISSVHEGNKAFKCKICDYSCSEKSDLKIHVASAHEGKAM